MSVAEKMVSETVNSSVEAPPLGTLFTLGPVITPEQSAYLKRYGYLHFRGALNPAEVETLRAEQKSLMARWVSEDTAELNGIPLFKGTSTDGSPVLTRMPFCSMHSDKVRELVLDARFEPIKTLVGGDVRCGHDEKDGVVMNYYENGPASARPRLGWHTDGLRDLFYGRMPQQMLNFGLHLDDISSEDGGLRLIPGTHEQGFWKMCFYKPYFVWHRVDQNELAVETQPGDLTVHDGRLWHRVAQSSRAGAVRRSIYVPYMTGPVEKKDQKSATPFYHHLGKALRRMVGGR